MNCAVRAFAIVSLALISFSAYAGPFSCTAYGTVECAKNIEDLVTDKFTAKYPNDKFEIVTLSEFQVYSDGGGVGYAVAGVVPKINNSDKYGNLSLFPSRRFASTRRITGDQVKPYQKTQHEIEILRNSIELLMEACNRDPDCNVMSIR